jgi:hypothetical protein
MPRRPGKPRSWLAPQLGNRGVQHDPVAALPKIVFEVYHKRQSRLTGENVPTSPQISKEFALFSNAKTAEDQIENVIRSRCTCNLIQCSQGVIKIEQ